jgi:hypothetical protein
VRQNKKEANDGIELHTYLKFRNSHLSTKGEEYWRYNVDSVELRTTLVGLDTWRFYMALPGITVTIAGFVSGC